MAIKIVCLFRFLTLHVQHHFYILNLLYLFYLWLIIAMSILFVKENIVPIIFILTLMDKNGSSRNGSNLYMSKYYINFEYINWYNILTGISLTHFCWDWRTIFNHWCQDEDDRNNILLGKQWDEIIQFWHQIKC